MPPKFAIEKPNKSTQMLEKTKASATRLLCRAVWGVFCRVFLEGIKVGIAGHTSTQAHATAQKVKKGNTAQLYSEGDPEGRFCRSPGWRMGRDVRGGPWPL